MLDGLFHPVIARWFTERFGEPTEPQRRGWPEIAAGRHTLIAAPTGSGKTLSAFLLALDRLWREALGGDLYAGVRVVYVSPLKALSNDIRLNLEHPLEEISHLAVAHGLLPPPIRAVVRTGDTPAAERRAMLRKPPQILVTTPESLYLLLTAPKSRQLLRGVSTVIVDEIHALARDKRGSHLALTLERLARWTERPPQRIGLSATQRPLEQIASFLVGTAAHNGAGLPQCAVVDAGHVRALDCGLEVPPSPLAAVCSNEQWGEVYDRLVELISGHRSTLVFVNTRRMAERVAHHLTERLGEEAVASHHGSLSKELRLSAEQRLKGGSLRALVATASLEMGIDIGAIDLVCQIGSPRGIATFLQRVGRSGHALSATPKGRLFPLTRDELLECLALLRAVRGGRLDAIEIPQQPLDILAQQLVAAAGGGEPVPEGELLEMARGAWPYRNLTAEDFQAVVGLLSEGVSPANRRGAWLHRDAIGRTLRARRGARLAALTSGGAIPETAEYRVVLEEEGTVIGRVDEDFAIDSSAGNIFLLGNNSWQIVRIGAGEVVVRDAHGAPPNIPFWFGEAPGRTIELSEEISRLRRELADGSTAPLAECGVDPWGAEQALEYVRAQRAAVGMVPTTEEILFERFFDESGGMQLVIHSVYGSRINRAWGLALRKTFCRSFDFELQAAADDDGIVLSLSPQHSFPIELLFRLLTPENATHLLKQALLAAPMFQVRWRWNATRALAVLRFSGGKKVPPHLQRFRSDDLLAACFPETVGCLENHHGDVEIPEHPLVRQTMHDCLTEAMDLERWLELLDGVRSGRVRLIARETREPSPFSHELLNANPYAFLDDAGLEERRTRAVSTRRSLPAAGESELAALSPEAIALVARQAWPTVRDAEELHDALMSLVLVRAEEGAAWRTWFEELRSAGRGVRVAVAGLPEMWGAAERGPLIRSLFPAAELEPEPVLPEELRAPPERGAARVALVRGQMAHRGPTTAAALAAEFQQTAEQVESALLALEADGQVMRGRYTPAAQGKPPAARGDAANPASRNGEPRNRELCNGEPGNEELGRSSPDDEGAVPREEWCDRGLLARIHRLTLAGLREQIEPVAPADFLRFLLRHQGVISSVPRSGPRGVQGVLSQLAGLELPAAAWEKWILPARIPDYRPAWLDDAFLGGGALWGRLAPPRDMETGESPAAGRMSRAMRIALFPREHLAQLIAFRGEEAPLPGERVAAEAWELLQRRGALFWQELLLGLGCTSRQLLLALRELARRGRATCDSFAPLRKRGEQRPARRRGGRSNLAEGVRGAARGRWCRFPGEVEPADRSAAVAWWAEQLLGRYGVLFRDLLARETAAPPWRELVPHLRRREMRGTVRGGRFVAGVAGEQFALPEAVDRLRGVRSLEAEQEPWVVLGAADPLNLFGIITPEERIPATSANALIVWRGCCTAVKIGRRVRFLQEVEGEIRSAMLRALHGWRPPPGETLAMRQRTLF